MKETYCLIGNNIYTPTVRCLDQNGNAEDIVTSAETIYKLAKNLRQLKVTLQIAKDELQAAYKTRGIRPPSLDAIDDMQAILGGINHEC